MRVLVTGADGFVGGTIATHLRQRGYDVVGAVFGRPPGPTELHCDLRAPDPLRAAPAVAAIVHAAGVVDMRASPAHMHAVHVAGTRAVADWAQRVGAAHLVHISSVAVYGPLTLGEGRGEATPRYGKLAGLPYMRTKALAEAVVEGQPTPYTILRPPAVVGPGDTVVSSALVRALSGAAIVLPPGASLGRQVSLVDVADLAEITATLLERGGQRKVLHATGPALPLGDVIELYAKALRVAPRIRTGALPWPRPASAGGLWFLLSALFGQSYASDRLVRYLGWEPGKRLEQAIRGAVSSLHADAARIS